MTPEEPPKPERAPAAESDWLRPAQAAELLGVPASTLRTLTEHGRLTVFYTEGEHRRYRRRDLVRLRAELDAEAGGSSPSG
jgi:excisionase family DNA binding protein